jgi:hypothetical protein
MRTQLRGCSLEGADRRVLRGRALYFEDELEVAN